MTLLFPPSPARSAAAPGPAGGRIPIAREAVLRSLLLLLLTGMTVHEVIVRLVPGSGVWDDLVLLALAGLLLVPSSWRGWEGRRRLLLPLAVFAAITVLAAVANGSPLPTFLYGIRLVLPYTVAGLAASRLRREDLPVFFRLVAVLGGLAAAYGILSFATFRAIDMWRGIDAGPHPLWQRVLLYPYTCGAYPSPGWRLVSTFMNDNFFGLWLSMVIPPSLVLWMRERRAVARAAWMVGIILMLLAFTWTYSRSAVLGFCVMYALCLWGLGRRIGWIVIPVIVAAPLLAAPMDRYRFNPVHLDRTQGGRVQSVRKSLVVLRRRPFLGTGPGTRGLADMEYAKVLYEGGVLGFLAFCWLIGSAVYPARRLPGLSPDDRRMGVALTAGMAAMIVAAVGGDAWEIPQVADTFWIYAGLLVTLTAVPRPRDETVSG